MPLRGFYCCCKAPLVDCEFPILTVCDSPGLTITLVSSTISGGRVTHVIKIVCDADGAEQEFELPSLSCEEIECLELDLTGVFVGSCDVGIIRFGNDPSCCLPQCPPNPVFPGTRNVNITTPQDLHAGENVSYNLQPRYLTDSFDLLYTFQVYDWSLLIGSNSTIWLGLQHSGDNHTVGTELWIRLIQQLIPGSPGDWARLYDCRLGNFQTIAPAPGLGDGLVHTLRLVAPSGGGPIDRYVDGVLIGPTSCPPQIDPLDCEDSYDAFVNVTDTFPPAPTDPAVNLISLVGGFQDG